MAQPSKAERSKGSATTGGVLLCEAAAWRRQALTSVAELRQSKVQKSRAKRRHSGAKRRLVLQRLRYERHGAGEAGQRAITLCEALQSKRRCPDWAPE